MIQNRWLYGALCAAFLLPLLAAAEALIKPVPSPDTSKLPPAQATKLAGDRAAFEKARTSLVGPPLAQAYADLGVIYARAGFTDAAAIALYDASQANPNDGRWFYLRGIIARELKRNAEARADFEAALAIDKIYLPIRYRLSDTLVDLGDVDGARKVLLTTTHDYPNAAAAFAMLGQLELRQKRYTQAIENLKRALAIEPKANQLYKPLAEALAGVGNSPGAQDAQAKAGNVPPNLPDPLAIGLYGEGKSPQSAGTTLQQAQQLAKAGKLAAARDTLAAILGKNPDDAQALALQARIEASVGDLLIAQAAAEHAVALAPHDGTVLMSRGMVYEYARDENHATDFYRRAVQADPKLETALLLLGNAEMRNGRFEQAAEQYRKIVEAQPNDSQAQARVVAAEVAAGQCKRALADISAAQLRSPRDGNLMQVFVRLASTCPGARQEERDMALDYAQALYKQRPDAGDSSALALALAAHGKFKEAQQYQAEAIFEALRSGDRVEADRYRSTQASFAAQKTPETPWPAGHSLFKPPLLTPAHPAPAKPAKP
jgi:tetratricopeptide (TPR) repeat protein